MKSFLAEVAARIYSEHPDNMDRVAVVFNNRRPGLFLSRQLLSLSSRPFFLPCMMGMDDIVSRLSGLAIIPAEFLLFELYDIHRQLANSNHKYDSFEDFISFGELMLRDFSEIDLYLVDAERLFANLHELKSIGEWDVSSPNLTPIQQQYLTFYRSLYRYYSQLRERLRASGQSYSGMAYREASEHVVSRLSEIPYEFVYFVGFNALSLSEQSIISAFVKEGRGALITDGDAYYFDDSRQEAGQFLRRQAERFPVPEGYPDHFGLQTKKITLVSCPENILQTSYAAERLIDFAHQGHSDFDQTAVVLADEKLLIPMLNAIPDEIPTVNVTLGFPFCYSVVNSLVISILNLHLHGRDGRFYHGDVADILSDHLLMPLIGGAFTPSKLSEAFESVHAVYASWKEFAELLRPMGMDTDSIAFLFDAEAAHPDGMLLLWSRCIQQLRQQGQLQKNPKEYAALVCWQELTDYFLQLQQQYHCLETLSVLYKFYGRIAKRHNVSFIGEPLAGLQLLGMLETRNLDFRRVILLSVNEGILPAGRNTNTLIPYGLKTMYGIPTYRDKDAVYANHFYSLLQRAEEVDLVFSTDADAMGKGEPSRFLLQVREELASRYPNIVVQEKVIVAEHTAYIHNYDVAVAKNPDVMRRLKLLADRGFSPSALNLYRHCPLNYYYRYVLGITEIDSFAEEVDASELGTCVHDILMDIYLSAKGRYLSAKELLVARVGIESRVQDWFVRKVGRDASSTGRNYLSAQVAISQLQRFLGYEINSIESGNSLKVESVEHGMTHPLVINVGGQSVTVNIIGQADRIDRENGIIRIADYKTGAVTMSEVSMSERKTEFPDKWFQVMTYAWLYNENDHPTHPFRAGIIPLRSNTPDFMLVSWGGDENISVEMLSDFEDVLRSCVTSLMDPCQPFHPIATPKSNDCFYCQMKSFCSLKRG